MTVAHYHACKRKDCTEEHARDRDEFAVWLTAPGGVNVVTSLDDGGLDWARETAADYEAQGTRALVMVRDVIRTSWRKVEDFDYD